MCGMVQRVCLMWQRAIAFESQGSETAPVGMAAEDLLEGVTVLRVLDHAELLAVCRSLEHLCQRIPRVQTCARAAWQLRVLRSHRQRAQIMLIVVDSIAFHARQEFGTASVRSRWLASVAQALHTATSKLGVAVRSALLRWWFEVLPSLPRAG